MKNLFLILSSLALSTLSFAEPGWGGPVAPRPESEALAQSVPIADVHMHFFPRDGLTVTQLMQRMQESHVRWGGGAGIYSTEMQAALGANYISALGFKEFAQVLMSSGQRGLQNSEHPVFVDFFKEAEVLLATGKARGFGEIHIDNKTTSNANDPFGRSIPLESPVVQRMYEIANEHKGFVQIHYDKSARTVEQIITMAQRYPKSLTIVAHCMPKGTPDDMRKIFDSAPNVMCEISGATYIHGIPRIVTADGINSSWLQMIEDYPDRIMMGTDSCCGLIGRYNEIVQVMRSRALAAMKPETLEKVAYKNALRVFGLPY
jgi:Tat protein secretion system quality control protein TatD with DNase activity